MWDSWCQASRIARRMPRLEPKPEYTVLTETPRVQGDGLDRRGRIPPLQEER